MGACRHAAWAAVVLASTSAACNTLLDNHDRTLDDRGSLTDATPNRRDSGSDADPQPAPDDSGTSDVDVPDGGGDAQPVVIDVPQKWKTPNGATWTTNDAGTTITGFTSAGHPVIVPVTQPTIPATDYTVVATVRAPSSGEFGILARIQADGSGALLGSKFGTDTRPWSGYMRSSDWNPYLENLGPPYTFTANARYKMKLRVTSDSIAGKVWDATKAEPDWQTIATIPWKTGGGLGYYIYNTYDAVLESVQVTVP